MKTQGLVDKGRRLARPCSLLKPRGANRAATWGGDGLVTVDLRYVPQLGLKGLLQVALDDDRGGVATHWPAKRLPSIIKAPRRLLFAHEARILPPIEIVLHGDRSKPTAKAIDAYERAFQGEHPLYRDDTWVMLGGFAQVWPEDDVTREAMGESLVLWTFRDSEPWVEVWHKRGKFTVIQRTT